MYHTLQTRKQFLNDLQTIRRYLIALEEESRQYHCQGEMEQAKNALSTAIQLIKRDDMRHEP
jgi:hypothetical protein